MSKFFKVILWIFIYTLNGSFLFHLPCLYDFWYVHWMYHDTFKLWINIECIMIQSRVKPEILSSNCVLIRKLLTVHNVIVQVCTGQDFKMLYSFLIQIMDWNSFTGNWLISKRTILEHAWIHISVNSQVVFNSFQFEPWDFENNCGAFWVSFSLLKVTF